MSGLDETTPVEGGDEDAMRTMFLTWLAEHLAIVETIGSHPAPWCPEWWKHPEVVARFRALWMASIQADADAGDGKADASSSWWLNHWDRHASVIFDRTAGPFRECDRESGHLHARKDRRNASSSTAALPAMEQPPADVDLS